MPFIPEDKSDVFDPRLKEVAMRCPDCDTLIYGSGRMEYSAVTRRWMVEFWCPIDKHSILAWSDSYASLVQSIATDFGY